ncbi:hypothetical protein AVEN_139984-1 [Araneus ventricosus]|uniref:Uncharacterized protein n=1 Tax=Araneus ventricosus TaxID=182803 RepID=A0A4Y2NG43_ARAVE|nr:hypothetical protein AVEN_139984-1 [Araneus ventricosus]
MASRGEGSGGLMVRSRRRRVPGSKPDFTEDLLCKLTCCMLYHAYCVKLPPANVMGKLGEGGCELRTRSRVN